MKKSVLKVLTAVVASLLVTGVAFFVVNLLQPKQKVQGSVGFDIDDGVLLDVNATIYKSNTKYNKDTVVDVVNKLVNPTSQVELTTAKDSSGKDYVYELKTYNQQGVYDFDGHVFNDIALNQSDAVTYFVVVNVKLKNTDFNVAANLLLDVDESKSVWDFASSNITTLSDDDTNGKNLVFAIGTTAKADEFKSTFDCDIDVNIINDLVEKYEITSTENSSNINLTNLTTTRIISNTDETPVEKSLYVANFTINNDSLSNKTFEVKLTNATSGGVAVEEADLIAMTSYSVVTTKYVNDNTYLDYTSSKISTLGSKYILKPGVNNVSFMIGSDSDVTFDLQTVIGDIDTSEMFNATFNNGAYTITANTEWFNNNDVCGTLVIPSTFDDGVNGVHPVTTIGDNAFRGNTKITDIIIPNSVTTLGQRSFGALTNLNNVVIPTSVKSIGYQAFAYSGFESIVIPNSVTSMGDGVFGFCTNLKNIVWSQNLTTIPKQTFYQCASLEHFDFTNNLTTIGWAAFRDSALAYADLSNTKVETIDERAFYNTTKLTEIKFPATLTTIKEMGFALSGIKSLDLSNTSVATLGQAIIFHCNNLVDAKLPSTLTTLSGFTFTESSMVSCDLSNTQVTVIPSTCFSNATSLTTVLLPDSITEIQTAAFYNCTNLKSLALPQVNHNVSLGETAFYKSGLEGKFYLPNNYKLEGNSNGQFIATKITSFRVDESNTRYMVVDGVIYGRGSQDPTNSLYNVPTILEAYPQGRLDEAITILSTVTFIRRYEIQNIDAVTTFVVEQGNTTYTSDEGALYDISGKGILSLPNGHPEVDYVVKDGTKVLGGVYTSTMDTEKPKRVSGYGFGGPRLNTLTLPTSLIAIDGCALQSCENLKSVNSDIEGIFDFTALTDLYEIGYKGLESCMQMKVLKLGTGIIRLGDGVVHLASNLEEIHCYAVTPPEWQYGYYCATPEDNFENLTNLKAVYVPDDSVDEYQAAAGWSKVASIIKPLSELAD